MDSSLFNKIGIGEIDPAYFLIGLAGFSLIVLIYAIIIHIKMRKLTRKYEKFMSGKDGKSLENLIARRFTQVDDLLEAEKIQNNRLDDLTENFEIAFQKIGMVKYDAFNEMGGKLSFALALLDKNNTGFLINSMHSREGCYTYIKEIIRGESYIVLGDEEKEALEKAVNSDNYMG